MKMYIQLSKRLSLALLTMCAGCSSYLTTGLPIQNGNYVPDVHLSGQALLAYHADVTTCQKEILTRYGDKYMSNNAITDVRHCLIKKGYVLLS